MLYACFFCNTMFPFPLNKIEMLFIIYGDCSDLDNNHLERYEYY